MRFNKFTGAVVAGSIVISSVFAAPASAGSNGDRIAAILLGAAAVGIIASAVNNNHRQTVVTRGNTYGYRGYRTYYNPTPDKCLRKRHTRYGWKTFYSQPCLNRHRANRRVVTVYQKQHDHSGHNHNVNANYYRQWNDTHR